MTADQRTCKHVWEGPRSRKHCAICGYVEGSLPVELPTSNPILDLLVKLRPYVTNGGRMNLEGAITHAMSLNQQSDETPAVRIEHECPRCHARLLTESNQCQHPIDATRYGPNGYFCGLCGASTEEPAEKATAAHPEDFCERCRRPNIVWFAPNEIWNAAHGEWGILCPVCFAELAAAAGFNKDAWRVAPEFYVAAEKTDAPRCNGLCKEVPDAICPVHGLAATLLAEQLGARPGNKCERCLGTGEHYDDGRCRDCDGTGWDESLPTPPRSAYHQQLAERAKGKPLDIDEIGQPHLKEEL
jgi:hypothetical protein